MQTFKIHEPSQISSRPFWDVRFEDLDFDNDKSFIIEKVMNHGAMSDFISTVKFYGKDIIRKEIIKAAYLKKDVLNFVCFYFDLKPTQFRCYSKRQLHPQLGNF
jgi:hypothetical protein